MSDDTEFDLEQYITSLRGYERRDLLRLLIEAIQEGKDLEDLRNILHDWDIPKGANEDE